MDLTWSLILDAQGQAATPCSGMGIDLNTDIEMGVLGDLMQLQFSNVFNIFNWWKASTMMLDELPESDIWYWPDYQLTEEWLERTVEKLTEINKEKWDRKSVV